jgi:hypothetical protein
VVFPVCTVNKDESGPGFESPADAPEGRREVYHSFLRAGQSNRCWLSGVGVLGLGVGPNPGGECGRVVETGGVGGESLDSRGTLLLHMIHGEHLLHGASCFLHGLVRGFPGLYSEQGREWARLRISGGRAGGTERGLSLGFAIGACRGTGP